MNAIIKKHQVANPWLNRTQLNNYKHALDCKKTISIDQNSQSLSSLTSDSCFIQIDDAMDFDADDPPADNPPADDPPDELPVT